MIYIKRDNKGTTFDFGDATLPDGQNIQKILEQNVESKKKIVLLNKELKDSKSILAVIFSNKIVRSVVEIIMLILSVIGLYNLMVKFSFIFE